MLQLEDGEEADGDLKSHSSQRLEAGGLGIALSLVRKLDENWVSERALLEISATHKSLAMKTCETDDRSCNIFFDQTTQMQIQANKNQQEQTQPPN